MNFNNFNHFDALSITTVEYFFKVGALLTQAHINRGGQHFSFLCQTMKKKSRGPFLIGYRATLSKALPPPTPGDFFPTLLTQKWSLISTTRKHNLHKLQCNLLKQGLFHFWNFTNNGGPFKKALRSICGPRASLWPRLVQTIQ